MVVLALLAAGVFLFQKAQEALKPEKK